MKNIQLIAPASYVPNLKKEIIEVLSEQLKKLDYHLCYTKYLFEKKYFLAGNDPIRLADLEQAFTNPKIDAILAIRGGEGTLRLLDKLDYQKIKKHPKPFIGFSDTTLLQNALFKKIKLPSYTGFVGKFGFQKLSPKTFQNLNLALQNKIRQYTVKTVHSGKAQGILLGGNLNSFCALLGTPYCPDMKGNILVLEEVSEPAYRLDRMLNQLKLAGIFHQISGLILGDMTAGLSTAEKYLANMIIKDVVSTIKCPIVRLNDYSHTHKKVILPLGVHAKIDTTQNILSLDKIEKFN